MGRGPALRLLPYGPSLVGQSASSELPESPGTLPILGCLDFPPLSHEGGVGQFPEASRNLDVEHRARTPNSRSLNPASAGDDHSGHRPWPFQPPPGGTPRSSWVGCTHWLGSIGDPRL
jgi:hypothetical protein